MARQKIGTSISDQLLREARTLASQEQKCLNEIIEEALAQYLQQKKPLRRPGVVRSTKGAIPAPASLVKEIIEEEPFLEV